MITFPKGRLTVRTYGDPVLKKIAAPVTGFGQDLTELSIQMIDAMKRYDGVGLAGNQIGIPYQIIVLGVGMPRPKSDNPDQKIELSQGESLLLPQMPMALINPQILSYGPNTDTYEEGCLSVPEIYAPVIRPTEVTIKTQLITGEQIIAECHGFLARVLQHEIDHLNGIVFVDRLTPEVLQEVQEPLNKLIQKGKKKGFLRFLSLR